MAETNPSTSVGPKHLADRFVTLDEYGTRPPLPGDTLTDLWVGQMNEIELIAAKSIVRIYTGNPPAFLNKPIGRAVAPNNFRGDLSNGFASIFEDQSHEVGNTVNAVYGYTLTPPFNRQAVAVIKAQYRPLTVTSGVSTVEREIVRLELEQDELEAFAILEEQPSPEAYQLAIKGVKRAINESTPFSGQPLPASIIRHDARDL